MSGLIINPYRFGGGGGSGGSSFTGITSGTPTNQSNSSLQAGWEFTADANIDVTGVRVWMRYLSGDETVRLWQVSGSTLLDSVTYPITVSDDWSATVNFSSPVSLISGNNYIITTRLATEAARVIRYETDLSGEGFTFDSNISYVTARYVDANTFPTSTLANQAYGLPDIVFTV